MLSNKIKNWSANYLSCKKWRSTLFQIHKITLNHFATIIIFKFINTTNWWMVSLYSNAKAMILYVLIFCFVRNSYFPIQFKIYCFPQFNVSSRTKYFIWRFLDSVPIDGGDGGVLWLALLLRRNLNEIVITIVIKLSLNSNKSFRFYQMM